jgi:hypothetical protein
MTALDICASCSTWLLNSLDDIVIFQTASKPKDQVDENKTDQALRGVF